MDIIFGYDIYTIISSYFNDYNDIIILCQVCLSMRNFNYKHNIYFDKAIFNDSRQLSLLKINLIEIHHIKPYELTLNHIKHYKSIKIISFNQGVFNKNVKNILSYSHSLEILSISNLRLDIFPITDTIKSIELINCIPMQCNFNFIYHKIKALHLSNVGFMLTNSHLLYFPNLEYLYVDNYGEIIDNISLNLPNLIYLNYEDMLISEECLSKLTKLEFLNVDISNINNLPINNSLKYLTLSYINNDINYRYRFPNLISLLYQWDNNDKIKNKYYRLFFNKRSNYYKYMN